MNFKVSSIAAVALLLAACAPTTRIVTYSPAPQSTYYSTTITPVRTRATTIVAQPYSVTEDISLHLDLQAVAALFSQSTSVQEFEQMLNSSTYPVSNLDLNGDGYIDYLRVLETIDGYRHVFLIQAVLAQGIYQDVATLVAEVPTRAEYYVEIIGAPYIYGPSYIVRPVFYARPPMFDCFWRPRYQPWRSPWDWGHFPPHYRRPAPVYLNHYQAYIHTYMTGHRYCHEVNYPAQPRYAGYDRLTREYQRNDYGVKYPNKSFEVRNANTVVTSRSGGATAKVRNAYDIRQNSEASKVTTVAPRAGTASGTSRSGSTTTGATTTSGTSRSTATTAGTATSRSGSTATSGTSRSGSTATTGTSGTSRSDVTGGTTSGSSRSTATTGTASGSTRSTAVSGSATPTTGTTGSRSTAASGTSRSTVVTGDTVVNSRVNSSGATTTTTTRSSGASRSTATSGSSRSTATSGSSRSSATSGSTRSSSASGSSSRSAATSGSSSSRSSGSAASGSTRSSGSSASGSSRR